jgi:UDP-N-acetylmuramoylalanine--D-glutamate ligase
MSKNDKSWLDYSRYAVIGLGRSGSAAARLLARRGKEVIASDSAPASDIDTDLSELPDSIRIETGANEIGDAEVGVVSPGIPPDADIIEELRSRGIPVISEVELAYEATDADILAVTGTDGKTTTTALLGEIFSHTDREYVVGGNIGTPLSDVVDDISDSGTLVAEISAFQLWSSYKLHVQTAGVTNIAEDHINYFSNWSEYVAAKRRILNNQSPTDWAVLNGDDKQLREWVSDVDARVLLYGQSHSLSMQQASRVAGLIESDGQTIWVEPNVSIAVSREIDISEATLTGHHHVENMMCAAGMALSRDISVEAIEEAFRTFEPSPHRFQSLGIQEGIKFIDDSKATNVNSSLAGLQSIDRKFVPIVGGKDKGLDMGPLVEFFAERDTPIVLIGEIDDRLTSELEQAGVGTGRIHHTKSMDEAVNLAYELAKPGQAIILSPACSSFDMFDSYAHRGRVFQEAVEKLSN